MGKFRRIDATAGRTNRQFHRIKRQLREERAAKRLPGSSFADIPPGSIPTSVLGNPSAAGYVSLNAAGFGLTAAGASVLSSPVTVPPVFTACVVSLTGRVFAYNSTPDDDFLYARASVQGVTGTALPVLALTGISTLNVATFTTIVTGLRQDDIFTVDLWAASATADWAADASNMADLSGVLLWF